jgi:hypothetical protein
MKKTSLCLLITMLSSGVFGQALLRWNYPCKPGHECWNALKSVDERQNARAFKLLSLMIIPLMLIAGSCTETQIREYEATDLCFTKELLETVPWMKAELAWFQQPKMGFLRVSVYRYRGDYYLAFENFLTSSPISHIFNCSGQHLGELNINYNEFYENIETTAVFLEDNY